MSVWRNGPKSLQMCSLTFTITITIIGKDYLPGVFAQSIKPGVLIIVAFWIIKLMSVTYFLVYTFSKHLSGVAIILEPIVCLQWRHTLLSI